MSSAEAAQVGQRFRGTGALLWRMRVQEVATTIAHDRIAE